MAVYLGRNQIALKGGIGGSATNVQYQTKSVDPTTTSVSVKPDDGYTLSEVIVNPIPTNFIGSGITKKSAQEYTPGNSSITINAGQYLSGAQTIKAVPTVTGSATSNGTYTPASGKYFSQFTVNVPPSGVTLPLLSQEVESTDQVLSGYQLISSDNTVVTGTMPNIGKATGTISTKAGTYTIAKGYHDGTGSVSISSTEQAKIIAENIKKDISILGITGTYEGDSKVTWSTATATGSANSKTLAFSVTGNPTMYYVVLTTASTTASNTSMTIGAVYDGSTTSFVSYTYVSMSRKITYASGTKATYSNGTLTITTPNNVSSGGSYKIIYTTDSIAAGSGSGGSGTSVNLQSNKTVTPTSFPTTVTPDSGYGGMSKVTINQPTGYVKPTGTLPITTNGTHNVTNYASVNVNVSSSSSGSGINTVLGTASSVSVSIGGYSMTGGSSSITYSSNKPVPTLNSAGTSVTLAFSGTTSSLSNISASTDFSVLKGKYISTGTTSSTFYFIPTSATFTYTEATTTWGNDSLSISSAQQVKMSLS